MTVEKGSRLGPYEIVSRIGAGGMGEVWRARDPRLDRDVAIKVLPAALAGNEQFRARFEREAKSISQLGHPHICTLYDVGVEGGVSYLVMELLEGESLADRLVRGPLSLTEVSRYGAQIASALDRAHRAEIIHRDLKPGNVVITKAGAKLLDFGLARSSAAPAVSADGATEHKPLTQEGTILGTFQYMAPEQLAGDEADSRSDIFALGALLYEMVTGKRAFEGKNRTSLIAAILEREPHSIAELQPLASPALVHIVTKCLAKDPDDRWQSAQDVAAELRWVSEAGSQSGVPAIQVARRKYRDWMAIGLVVALAVLAGVLATLYVRASRSADRALVAEFIPPPGTQFNDVGDYSGPPVLSPDGRYLVFSAAEGPATMLWLRTLATGEVRRISGTETGTFPFWSPDSRNIGFFSTTSLKRVDISGGTPLTLAPTTNARGGSWSKDDVIVYAASNLDPLMRLTAAGGKPVPATKMNGALHSTHRWPFFLPDGKSFLYLAANHQEAASGSNGVYLAHLRGGEPRLLLNTSGNASYAAGQLLFVRDTTLYAQAMSVSGTLSGEPRPVVEGVLNDRGIWRGGFSTSDSGDLVYCIGQAKITSKVVWVDRAGKELSMVAGEGTYWDVRLSPDETKLALSIGDPARQLWLLDLTHHTRILLDSTVRWSGFPTWSPDGSTLFANSVRPNGTLLLIARRLDGSASRDLSEGVRNSNFYASNGSTVTPDGRTVIYTHAGSLWRRAVDGSDKPVKLTPEAMNTSDPELSPDGHWLAFVSSENDRRDIFIALASDLAQRWQITDSGMQPHWRADGREFYFIDGQDRLTAVPIGPGKDALDMGKAEPLFRLDSRGQSRVYDVAHDGQRFIVNRMPEATGVGIRLITSWVKAKQPQ